MEEMPLQRLPLGSKGIGRLVRLAVRFAVILLLATPSAILPKAPVATPSGVAAPAVAEAAAQPPQCQRTITAEVVALDQPIIYNRLGAITPAGMIYALRRDVIDKNTGQSESEGGTLQPGNVQLRDDKRPRPLTLRMNVGDCLKVPFQNLLSILPLGDQPATRSAGFHVNGLQLVNSMMDDGSNVGANASSLVAPGGTITYTLYAEREATNLIYSPTDHVSAELVGTTAFGLFGAVNVEPRGAEWYRSQVTRDDIDLATVGTTADGHPIINYDAKYPVGHRFAGLPILSMLDGNTIVHSDLTAIITGPNHGRFPAGTYPVNPALPDREQPFRELTTIFHDEIANVQAFPQFRDPALEFTLQPVQDAKGINYGVGGIGAEIIANRVGVGPMHDCPECEYEEYFLSSWAVGDPGMVVDVPANTTDGAGKLITGPKASKALYPDDPSNVYHSYINDHTKIRNLHVGKEHHIFHLHAHQWLFTPDSDDSTYLDSQAVGPGSAYTYDIAHGGSGNRNKTPGDSILHCHFYPHLSQGMWALWRSHDVFERGTQLDANGVPLTDPTAYPDSRALPDGEIAAGTPIPAVVPLPTVAMAPMPEAKVWIVAGQTKIDENGGNPGYPFYIPAAAGHRPATPVLDMTNPADMAKPANERTVFDGGLPRHVITSGTATHVESALDFSKSLVTAAAEFIPEDGTPAEKAAMAFHAKLLHDTYKPDGTPAKYETNGLPPSPGAPYAEPCRQDAKPGDVEAKAIGDARTYKAAAIQLDLKLNKAGWHFPQARILTLWDDVQPTLDGARAPEPLVMRANTNDCVTFYHTNLLPNVYEQDAYQVRTPTDIIGQHIHLVKFDVTSSDGSGNGFNYEDGTLSPDAVRERIRAIRANNGCVGAESGDPRDGSNTCPVPKAHPFFGAGPGGKWLGARTTIQRWYVDPLVNRLGEDRTLGNVFTHDHFAPSTHQQTGLYATLITEPTGSQWRNPETGSLFGVNQNRDGGPTSWRADILTRNAAESFREFYFGFADFQHAYEAGHGVDPQTGKIIPDAMFAINPSGLKVKPLPNIIGKPQPGERCANGLVFSETGCPQAISAADVGTFVVNYRNEPVALRVHDPATNAQAAGRAGDLSFAFSSRVTRADERLNVQPDFYPRLTNDVGDMDPFTPLVRVYDNDKVRIRIQVGANEEGHNTSVNGVKWRQEFANMDSGWRNSMMGGLSEQFIMDFPVTRAASLVGNKADYLYALSSSSDGIWNGNWGIMRSYANQRKDLLPLPNNPIGAQGLGIDDLAFGSITNLLNFSGSLKNLLDFRGMCPSAAPTKTFRISAVTARDALPGSRLVYNPRVGPAGEGPLFDPTAILYVRSEDLSWTGKLRPGIPIEPLVLRANAGDCVEVFLTNRLPGKLPDLDGFNTLPPIVDGFNANDVRPSSNIGLRPQMLAYDVSRHEGANVGRNPVGTAGPGETVHYLWYAGDVQVVRGKLVATPVEFGATNLISSDRIKHSSKGAIGALIIEPKGATWVEDATSRASATVKLPNGTKFRDFVLLFQNDLNLRLGKGSAIGNGDPLPMVAAEEDAEDSGGKALNYRTEPLWFRLGIDPGTTPGGDGAGPWLDDFDFTNALSNSLVGADPVTPVFKAVAGTPIRLRVLNAGGHGRNEVFALHGHVWQREPYVDGSASIGNNPTSEWKGTQEGHGPTEHWDIVPQRGAGGLFGIKGDYLFRDFASFGLYNGLWGILRVE